MSRDRMPHSMVILGRQEDWRHEPRYQELRQALSDGQIVPYYQPIVAADTRQVVALEALARWEHPEKGLLPPVMFIPFAESSGLIHLIGKAILTEACRAGEVWHQEGYRIDMYVNVSPAQLSDPNFPDTVQSVLTTTGFSPTHLHLELTEQHVVNRSSAFQDVMTRLRNMGVRMVLDDYGTECASLQCLLNHPFSTVKLDQLFIRDLTSDEKRATIVELFLILTRRLGLEMIAEGIETEQEADFLIRHHCTKLQGYLFGRPESREETTRRLHSGSTEQNRQHGQSLAHSVGSSVSAQERSSANIRFTPEDSSTTGNVTKSSEFHPLVDNVTPEFHPLAENVTPDGLERDCLLYTYDGLADYAEVAASSVAADHRPFIGSSVKSLERRLRDYEWLEQCTTPIVDADDVFSIMESVRNLFQDRFPFDRFGILIGTINDRYCKVNEIVTRDDLEPVEPGSLMAVHGTGLERVYNTEKFHYNPDIASHPEFTEDPDLNRVGVRSMVRLPLVARGRVFGVMTIKHEAPDAYTPDDLELMQLAANRLAPSIYSLRLIDSLQEAAYKDGLTGAFNRRFLTESLANPSDSIMSKLTGFQFKEETPLVVLFIDLDGLKMVNDTYGHAIGDDELRRVSRQVQEAVGELGIVIRYGGDEFLVMLPEVSDAVIEQVWSGLAISSVGASTGTCTDGECSFTVGVSKGRWRDLKQIIHFADVDMYQHKVEKKSKI